MTAAKKGGPAPLIVTARGRLSFPSLFEMRTNEDGNSRYEANLLLPPGFDAKPLLKALKDVAIEEFGPEDDWPEKMRRPEDVVRTLKKAQMSDKTGMPMAGYEAGWTVLPAAHSKNQPQVVDALKEPITDPKQAYGGRWARFAVRPFAFRNKSKGVSLSLVYVQLLKHDTPFGGPPPARDVFDDIADEIEDGDVI